MRQHWDLQKDDEKHDIIPEIYLGKNVADFIDPDIMKVGHEWSEVFLKGETTAAMIKTPAFHSNVNPLY